MFEVNKCISEIELESLAYYDIIGQELDPENKISELEHRASHRHIMCCEECKDTYTAYQILAIEFGKAISMAESEAITLPIEDVNTEKLHKHIMDKILESLGV